VKADPQLTYFVDCLREALRLSPLERHEDKPRERETEVQRFYRVYPDSAHAHGVRF
jgi:hypothetical protein